MGGSIITRAPAPFQVYPASPLGPDVGEGVAVRTYRGKCAFVTMKEGVTINHAYVCTDVGLVGEIFPPPSVKNEVPVPQVGPQVVSTKVQGGGIKVNRSHLGISAKSDYWEKQLRSHPDKEFAHEVLSMVKYGAPVGHTGVIESKVCENWPSAYKFREGVQEYIDKHLASGAIEGPLTEISNMFVGSPLGAFEKGCPKKLRVIHDLSWPPGGAVNDNIDKQDYSVQYTSVKKAVDICCKMSSPWLAKTDLADAYLHCPIKDEDSDLLGFTWIGTDGVKSAYKFKSLVLGLRSSPKHFTQIALALCYICVQNGAPVTTIQYLDDFLVCAESQQECQSGLETVVKCAKECGFEIKDKKTVGPSRVLEFLGLTIDTLQRQVRISEEKMVELRTELVEWKNRKKCKKRELLSVLGKLNFASQVVNPGHMFTRRLITLSKVGRSLYSTIFLDKECRKDLSWWCRNLESHNGVGWFPREFDVENAEIMFSDAADGAAAAVYNDSWTIQKFEGEYAWIKDRPICYKEMYAVVLGVGTFRVRLRGKQLLMNVDNMTVYHCIESGKSTDAELMSLIRTLYLYTSQNAIEYKICHVPGVSNEMADSLSRNRLDLFRKYNPSANVNMTRPCRVITDY